MFIQAREITTSCLVPDLPTPCHSTKRQSCAAVAGSIRMILNLSDVSISIPTQPPVRLSETLGLLFHPKGVAQLWHDYDARPSRRQSLWLPVPIHFDLRV